MYKLIITAIYLYLHSIPLYNSKVRDRTSFSNPFTLSLHRCVIMSALTEMLDANPDKTVHDVNKQGPSLEAGSEDDTEKGLATSAPLVYLHGAKVSTTKLQFWTVLFG